jgi:hypothetical protein
MQISREVLSLPTIVSVVVKVNKRFGPYAMYSRNPVFFSPMGSGGMRDPLLTQKVPHVVYIHRQKCEWYASGIQCKIEGIVLSYPCMAMSDSVIFCQFDMLCISKQICIYTIGMIRFCLAFCMSPLYP